MIMGYAGRIADRSVEEEIREQAVIIQTNSDMIKELVQDLNLVSQLEYDMHPLRKETIIPVKLIREYVVRLYNGGLLEKYELKLETGGVGECPTIEGDAMLLQRVVANLVQNSMKHNPEGCNIKIDLHWNEQQVELRVSDNGRGISKERMTELEQKPHYMNSEENRLDLQHGLGLKIVRRIAEVHQAEFSIRPSKETGLQTTLTFKKS